MANHVYSYFEITFKSEASDYVELMDKTSCERILTMYGYSEGEKKKMLKGIK